MILSNISNLTLKEAIPGIFLTSIANLGILTQNISIFKKIKKIKANLNQLSEN